MFSLSKKICQGYWLFLGALIFTHRKNHNVMLTLLEMLSTIAVVERNVQKPKHVNLGLGAEI